MKASQIRYIIAPTLLNAFDFLQSCPPSWRDRAHESLLATLYRKPFEVTPEIQKGFDFEKAVQECCEDNRNIDRASPGFQEVVRYCKGGMFQHWTKVDLTLEECKGIDGPILVTYNGKIDVILQNELVDLKTTGTFKDTSRYENGWQHIVYCIAQNVSNFRYLVAEWERPESLRVKKVYHIPVIVDVSAAQKELIKHTSTFFEWLLQENLWKVYLKTYCRNANM